MASDDGVARPGPAVPGSADWPDRLREFATTEPTFRRSEMRRLADAMRGVLHRLTASPAPIEAISGAADDLERLAEAFDAFPERSIYEGFAEAANAGDMHAFFDHSPMIGRANPLAPPIELWAEGDTMYGRATFGSAYEGPPGCVHGGFVAAAFDEVLGSTQSLGGRPGMTGRLIVHYRKPTPLHTELRFEGRIDRIEGRKTFTTGEVFAGDLLCAEAEALFISVDTAKFSELKELRDRRDAQSR